MKLITALTYSFFTVLTISIMACASRIDAGEVPIIEYRLNESVGLIFSKSNWNRPTGATRRELIGDGLDKEYEYVWRNGCAFILSVESGSDKIVRWRYTSDPQLCKNIKSHTFGT